jgi:hypothetical protein
MACIEAITLPGRCRRRGRRPRASPRRCGWPRDGQFGGFGTQGTAQAARQGHTHRHPGHRGHGHHQHDGQVQPVGPPVGGGVFIGSHLHLQRDQPGHGLAKGCVEHGHALQGHLGLGVGALHQCRGGRFVATVGQRLAALDHRLGQAGLLGGHRGGGVLVPRGLYPPQVGLVLRQMLPGHRGRALQGRLGQQHAVARHQVVDVAQLLQGHRAVLVHGLQRRLGLQHAPGAQAETAIIRTTRRPKPRLRRRVTVIEGAVFIVSRPAGRGPDGVIGRPIASGSIGRCSRPL